MLLLANNLSDDPDDKIGLDTLDGVYNESQKSYQILAQLSGFNEMKEILAVFAEKMIQNLMTSCESTQEEHRQIVDLTLEVLSSYLINSNACKHISELPVVKQLAQAHVSQFNILQQPSQVKQLGQFFRVLTSLWVTEEFISNFHDYLNQLNPILNDLFAKDTETL